MKILFVSDTYYPHFNGVYNFVRQIAAQLQEKGHEVAVLAPSETGHSTRKKIDKIDVFGVPSLPVFFYPRIRIPVPFILTSSIKEVMLGYNPDIIHVQSHFFLGKATVRLSKRFGIPVLGTNHFMPENLTALLGGKKWKQRLEPALWNALSKVFNQLPMVTAPTETAACLIRHRLNSDVTVISNGIDLQKFNPDGDLRFLLNRFDLPEKPLLLFVGRLDPEKKLDEVLQAVAMAHIHTDFHFVVAGKGVARENLENLTNQLGITKNVTFTGFIPDEDLPYYYKLSSCFMMASTAELQSIATMEAMASGLPVIAVDAGALGELVKNEVNGYLFEPGDIDGIARCLRKAFAPNNQLKKMGIKSLEIIQHHDIYKSVEAFQAIYLKIIQEAAERVGESNKLMLRKKIYNESGFNFKTETVSDTESA